MDNEYNNDNNNNNNFNGEFPNGISGQDNNQNSINNMYQGDQQKTDNSYYSGNNYSDNNINSFLRNNYNPNMGYTPPAPVVKDGGQKPKKKRGAFNLMKLVAAAVIFGITAGGAFQGYNTLVQPNSAATSQVESSDKAVLPSVSNNDNTSGTVIVPTSTSKDGVVTDVSDVVEKVMPSIVAINSTGTTTVNDFFGRQSSQPFEGSGSGIIVGQTDSDILIVTNNHVIAGANTVEIVFSDDTKAAATIKGAEANSDLAVLTVPMSELSKETAAAIKVATLGDSSKVKAGEMAIAIGNALGYGQSVTVGYISAVNREVNIDNTNMTLLQTDAAINPGNSGGALINTSGEVIGINSVKYASQDVEGMGYAIPISDAIPRIEDLTNRETIAESEQGFLGIYANSAQNVTEVYAEQFNMPIGVYVNEVVKDSPADTAGIKQGHIITKVNDQSVKTIDDLLNILSYKKAGEVITLTVNVLNNGEYVEKNVTVTLGAKNNQQ